MDRLRVLVVDDSLVYRNIISKAVEKTDLALVDCTASSGITALERLEQRVIDVVLLDIFMPEMDGIETLAKIKSRYRNLPVIVISSGGEDGAEITVRALEKGAMDFILKPLEGDGERNMATISRHLGILFSQIIMDKYTIKKHREDYRTKILRNSKESKIKLVPKKKAAAMDYNELKLDRVNRVKDPDIVTVDIGWPKRDIGDSVCLKGIDLLVIASSTGGPSAVEKVFQGIDGKFTKPILLVQHMPPDFTRIFAQFLDKKLKTEVKEAEEGDEIIGGRVLVAPGGFHMLTQPGKEGGAPIISLDTSPPVNGVRPAADVLFNSIAENYRGQRVLVIMLTGMGSDGTNGLRTLKESCQCYCITQSEETSVIYGMPRSVYEAGLSDEIAHLKDISGRIIEINRGRC